MSQKYLKVYPFLESCCRDGVSERKRECARECVCACACVCVCMGGRACVLEHEREPEKERERAKKLLLRKKHQKDGNL